MRIGFDFDNTVVDYTFVFTKIANHLGLKYENNPKNSIKFYFETEMNNPSSWKEVQLQVYCELINSIKPESIQEGWNAIGQFTMNEDGTVTIFDPMSTTTTPEPAE